MKNTINRVLTFICQWTTFTKNYFIKNYTAMSTKSSSTKNTKNEQLDKLNDYRLKKLIQALAMSSDTNMTRIYTAIKSVES
jgi:hypothetical protein